MKKFSLLWTVAAVIPSISVVLAFTAVLMFTACENPEPETPGGKLTITDAGGIDGKYVVVSGSNGDEGIMGYQSFDRKNGIVTGIKVVNGTVSLPLFYSNKGADSLRPFTADKIFPLALSVLNSPSFSPSEEETSDIYRFYIHLEPVSFKSGSAKLSLASFTLQGEEYLTGSASITGTVQEGETLTAATTNLSGTGTIGYQWQ
ncbi:MAG: hypothetical protein LBG05_03855, partial [Treponema sp.]|nr:hypothetical protein [Treponema sp.]